MITLQIKTVELIEEELLSIPEKYHTPFHSLHEGLGILREEYVELENEIFFGEKKAKKRCEGIEPLTADSIYKNEVRKEAVQVACMAIRIIQELT